MFMLALDSTILNTSLPAIAASQRVPPLALSAVVTGYLLAAAVLLPISAWLGDRFGMRRVFLVGVGLFTLASVMCGLAQSSGQLVFARVLEGGSAALLMPLGRTMALRGARREDVVGITALLTWPMLFGPVLGPPLGGLISTYASWRWNFLLNIPIGLVGMLFMARWLPDDEPVRPRPLDAIGFMLCAGGLALFLGGVEWISHGLSEAGDRLGPVICTALGMACLALTSWHLRKAPHPVVSLSPFDHPTFVVSTVGGTLAVVAIQSTPFLLPLLFQLGMGRSAVAAGLLLLPYFVANLGMKTITTPILHRFGFRTVLIVSSACSTLSVAAFAAVGGDTPPGVLLALLVIAGCTRSMLMTAIPTLGVADMPPAKLAASSALSAISMQVAGAMGVAVGALALAVSAGQGARQHLLVQDFHAAFLVVAIFNALALIPFWRLSAGAGSEILLPRHR